jgi:thioredoxin reductase (NADPH)
MRDVVIVGSGCAGLTAAIYAARADLEPLCIAGYEMGGQLMITTDVENYPGFPEGVQGPELIEKFKAQAERFGTDFVEKDVTDVDFDEDGGPHTLELEDETVEARSVVIATGSSAKWLGLDSEQRLRGHGVSACATCDGFFFKDDHVVVIGGGDTAMEEALFLTKFASKVTVIHRRDELRASKIMQERAFESDEIEFLWNTEVVEVLGDDAVGGVRVIRHPEGRPKERLDDWEDPKAKAGEAFTVDCQGVFLAIGHVPNTGFLEGSGLELDDQGYVEKQGHETTFTNIDGVFVAGDVFDYRYRQAVTAAGSGCKAAMDAEQWLEEKKLEA